MKKMMPLLGALALVISSSAHAGATTVTAAEFGPMAAKYISILQHSGSNCTVWANLMGEKYPSEYSQDPLTYNSISIMDNNQNQLAQFTVDSGANQTVEVTMGSDSFTASTSLIETDGTKQNTENRSGSIMIDKTTQTVTITQPNQKPVSCTTKNLLVSEDPHANQPSGPQF